MSADIDFQVGRATRAQVPDIEDGLVEIGQKRKNGAHGENVAQLTANWSDRGRAYIFERETEKGKEEEEEEQEEEENKRK
ncbi:hypothetical protein M0804_010573 [Polistes exclamans]|nr:hypothetical protein M0804_010573 [Polistes exclamans]